MNAPASGGAQAGSSAPALLGDSVPESLAGYYRALDDGRFDDAADRFVDGCLYAVPQAGLETSPRVLTEGRAALRERFEARGRQPRAHVVQLCVVDGDECLVEGVTIDTATGEATETFVAAATTSPLDGRIVRYLAFACKGARDPIPTDAPTSARDDVAEVLHRYFGSLDSGAFEAAARCFSDDVLYSHPPYRHTGIDSDQRVEFRGYEELIAAFRARGPQSFGHDILTCTQHGSHALLEGAVRDLPNRGSGSFISSLSLNDEGRISRYVSFYCEPAVAQRRMS